MSPTPPSWIGVDRTNWTQFPWIVLKWPRRANSQFGNRGSNPRSGMALVERAEIPAPISTKSLALPNALETGHAGELVRRCGRSRHAGGRPLRPPVAARDRRRPARRPGQEATPGPYGHPRDRRRCCRVRLDRATGEPPELPPLAFEAADSLADEGRIDPASIAASWRSIF